MKINKKLYRFFIGNFIILILIAAVFILTSMFRSLSETVQELSYAILKNKLDIIERELSELFTPIERQLRIIKAAGSMGLFEDIHNHQKLNEYFIPILENHPQLSSILMADDLGNEYMLLNADSMWITRLTRKHSKTKKPVYIYWKKWPDYTGIPAMKKDSDKVYDPTMRPWYQLALKNNLGDSITWTNPYAFFTTGQPGITASAKWDDLVSGRKLIFGADVLLDDISEFTINLASTPNSKIFVLTVDDKVIGLPEDDRFINPELRKKFILRHFNELNIPEINAAIAAYNNQEFAGDTLHTFDYRFGNQIWWAGVREFNLGFGQKLVFGIVLPETDFSKTIEQNRRFIIADFIIILLMFGFIINSFYQLKKKNKLIAREKDKNEQLLLNTLPLKVVNELKESGKSDPQRFDDVTVCFADIVGFTDISSKLDPKLLIDELNDIYTTFDEIVADNGCERIKTIGDAYLAVCGMPQQNENHAELMLKSAIEILDYIDRRNISTDHQWKMRIGLHSGAVVGGIVGVKKYIYDVFGDTINTASRMETYSAPMKVNISEKTYLLVKDSEFVRSEGIIFEKRDPIQVKGKGLMNMYFASRKT